MTKLSNAEILSKLGELDELRAALLGQVSGATSQEKIRALEERQPHVKPKTKEMEALLMTGYNMTIATAKRIIKERDENPLMWPLERYEAAKAMLTAYEATPEVISKRAGWQRSVNY